MLMGSPFSLQIDSCIELIPEFDDEHEACFPEPHQSNLAYMRTMKCSDVVQDEKLRTLLSTVNYACKTIPLVLYRSVLDSGMHGLSFYRVCDPNTWVADQVHEIREKYGDRKSWRRDMGMVVSTNDINMVKWGRTMGFNMDENAFFKAASVNNIEILKWLAGQGCKMHPWAYGVAAANANIEMLDWLWEHKCPLPTELTDSNIHSSAAESGSIPTLEWTLKHFRRSKVSLWTTARAARGGHVHMLEYLRACGLLILHKRACAYAAKGGSLEALKWLRETKGCPWNEWTCLNAAEHGHLSVLEYAIENGCPFDAGVVTLSAKKGRLDVFRFCIERGLPRNSKPFSCLIRFRHTKLIAWALENSSQFTPLERSKLLR
jgi:hypothetical protein